MLPATPILWNLVFHSKTRFRPGCMWREMWIIRTGSCVASSRCSHILSLISYGRVGEKHAAAMLITSHMKMTLEVKRVCSESQEELCVFRRDNKSDTVARSSFKSHQPGEESRRTPEAWRWCRLVQLLLLTVGNFPEVGTLQQHRHHFPWKLFYLPLDAQQMETARFCVSSANNTAVAFAKAPSQVSACSAIRCWVSTVRDLGVLEQILSCACAKSLDHAVCHERAWLQLALLWYDKNSFSLIRLAKKQRATRWRALWKRQTQICSLWF